MLSMSNVANNASAGAYYEQADDYYSRDRSPSVWSGLAAETLGLRGEVQAEDFRAMLDGRLPNGVALHHAGEGSGRRGGTDLTFSAPKSVSLQALVAGDTRLLQAHETAVARALDRAEELAACRVTVDGVTTKQTTGTLAVAQFRHDLSRAADPQLHTHAVLLNVTQRRDGEWRALDNEALYRNKMWLGAFYRSELAKEVQALGYELRVTHADGRFELAHVAPEQVKAFSGRAKMMAQALERLGVKREDASARQMQIAALATREAKQVHDRALLLAEWKERATAVGLALEKATAPASAANAGATHEAAARAVAYAAAHLMEREAVVQRVDIERAALERSVGQADLGAIRAAIEQAVQRGEFIRGTGDQAERYTTPAAQQRERDILGTEAAGRGQAAPMMTREAVALALVSSRLNDDQRGVVAHVLAGVDRIAGVQGTAGTGKTTALRAVRELVEASAPDMKLVGLAPSADAARQLAGSGIESQTLAKLAAKGYAGLDAKTLVVLDEASMVSARDMHALLTAAEKAGARVLLVGDVRQLKAVQAGRPFAQLQAAGMGTARLEEIQRQQDPVLKAAVERAAVGDVAGSLERLRPSVIEIASPSERHRGIALDYAALTADERRGTLVMAGTNASREAINDQVREALGLKGQGVELQTLGGKNLTEAQALRTVSYEAGDVVRADRAYKTLGLQRGDFATVVDGRAGVVTLQRADGERVEWRPTNHPHFSAYTATGRELAEGDVVRFTSNDYRAGFVNGERATVHAVEPERGRLLLEKADGARLVLRTDGPLYLEHGYAQTVHAAQGQTSERAWIEATAAGAMGNEASHYVAISRATHEVRLYTDDAQGLPRALGREDFKSAALDVQREKAVDAQALAL